MAFITVDSKNTFGGTYIEEAGSYNVEIVHAALANSSNGNQYVSIDYRVVDGPYTDGEVRYQNVTFDNHSKEAAAMSEKRFNTILVAIGVPDGTQVNSIQEFATGIMHKKLGIDVDWGEPNRNGKVYLSVTGYHKLDPEGSKPNGVKRPQDNSVPATSSFGNGFGSASQPSSQRHIDPTAPIEPPATNGNFGNTTAQQATSDPFANNNGQPIDISDDDLPF
ncbi:DUF669 domain-containing protein [Lacticaseibacillus saniviri]